MVLIGKVGGALTSQSSLCVSIVCEKQVCFAQLDPETFGRILNGIPGSWSSWTLSILGFITLCWALINFALVLGKQFGNVTVTSLPKSWGCLYALISLV